MAMVKGHPYLVRLAMYHLVIQPISLEQLLRQVPTEAGIYVETIRPYAQSMRAWYASGCKDRSKLLSRKALKEAIQWKKDKSLSERDHQYLNASKEAKHSQRLGTLLILGILYVGAIFSVLFVRQQVYEKFAFCPIKQGILAEKIEDICFRTLITSGDRIAFLSGSNFQLKKGIEYFKQRKYEQAIKIFEQAIESDRTDAVPQIYFNNAQARLKGNPLKIAVVVPIDYYEDAAKEVLKGVADAQTKFNKNNGKDGRLLEIVIANDGNQPPAAKRVAKDLANDKDILGIIGHHASESTQAALPIYAEKGIAVVSPTSASSKLESKIFFRTVGSTKVAAPKYAQYIKNYLHLDEIAVFYNPNSEYSQSLNHGFEKAFKEQGGKLGIPISLSDPQPDIKKSIQDITQKKIKAALLIPSVETNSISIAIARENSQSSTQKLQLLSAMSLSEKTTLEKGGNAVEGMILFSPCLAKNSDYMIKARERWQQKEIYWRVATSYDATQALIEAIQLSKEPTREETLKNLESLKLPVNQTSGFGLNWSDSDYHSNAQEKYCLFQIRHHKFEEIPEK